MKQALVESLADYEINSMHLDGSTRVCPPYFCFGFAFANVVSVIVLRVFTAVFIWDRGSYACLIGSSLYSKPWELSSSKITEEICF